LLGIINLNKPVGKTSHDMVALVRCSLGIRRVGHTGTLDPAASGVLPILVGKATGLSELLTDKTKRYTARVRVGIATDSYDTTGEITQKSDVRPTLEMVQAACQSFLGTIRQVPPMYSAIKVGGKKLYELARQGITIEREAREVTIHSLCCRDFTEDGFTLDVVCSKGTYIRSLCHDLGKALGTCAAMESLVRTGSGMFTIEDAITPEELVRRAEAGDVASFLLPPETVLADYPAACLSPQQGARVRNGLRYRLEQVGIKDGAEGSLYRLYEGDTLLCLSKAVPGEGSLVLAMEVGFYE